MKSIKTKNNNIYLKDEEQVKRKENHLLIKTMYSSISPGTENSLISLADDIERNLGYSASGVIVEVDDKESEYQVGDFVAVYGAPYVGHREYLSVPRTLCAKVRQEENLMDASMAGLGSIAMHALRLANLQFGETIVVIGLGIYGQLISQIALNAGLQVFAINRSKDRAELLSQTVGIKTYTSEEKLLEDVLLATNNHGADAVFICAGSDSSYLTNRSLDYLRDRGKSIIVGDVQPNYDRSKVFSKEIEILVSRAGGPGRYDKSYEMNGVDYPLSYVRWTEGRNVQEFVRLVEMKRINVKKYYDNTYTLAQYEEAYEDVNDRNKKVLTAIFKY